MQYRIFVAVCLVLAVLGFVYGLSFADPGLHYAGVVGPNQVGSTSASITSYVLPAPGSNRSEYVVGALVLRAPFSDQFIQVGLGFSFPWDEEYQLKARGRSAIFYSTANGAVVIGTVPLRTQVSVGISHYPAGQNLVLIRFSWYDNNKWNFYTRTVYVPGWGEQRGRPLAHVEAFSGQPFHPRAIFAFSTDWFPNTDPQARLVAEYPYSFLSNSTPKAFTIIKSVTGETE